MKLQKGTTYRICYTDGYDYTHFNGTGIFTGEVIPEWKDQDTGEVLEEELYRFEISSTMFPEQKTADFPISAISIPLV